MPSITNRSNYVVVVQGKPDRTKRFPFNKKNEALRYLRDQRNEQAKEGKGPETVQLTQLEDKLLVRIRHKGYPTCTFMASSFEEAERQSTLINAERLQGRRIDYNKARTISLAELFDRYIDEVCPRHKGCQTETYILNSFLEDHRMPPLLPAPLGKWPVGQWHRLAWRARPHIARALSPPRH